jgi:hypothetical protein
MHIREPYRLLQAKNLPQGGETMDYVVMSFQSRRNFYGLHRMMKVLMHSSFHGTMERQVRFGLLTHDLVRGLKF